LVVQSALRCGELEPRGAGRDDWRVGDGEVALARVVFVEVGLVVESEFAAGVHLGVIGKFVEVVLV
jgi:hypothetical protein